MGGVLRLPLRSFEYPLVRTLVGTTILIFTTTFWFSHHDDDNESRHASLYALLLLLLACAILRGVGVLHLSLMIGYLCYRFLVRCFLFLRPI